jgi:hypothetical protein
MKRRHAKILDFGLAKVTLTGSCCSALPNRLMAICSSKDLNVPISLPAILHDHKKAGSKFFSIERV